MKKGSLFVMILGSLFLVACGGGDNVTYVPVEPDAGTEPDATIVETDAGTEPDAQSEPDAEPKPVTTQGVVGHGALPRVTGSNNGFLVAWNDMDGSDDSIVTTDDRGNLLSATGMILPGTAVTGVRYYSLDNHYGVYLRGSGVYKLLDRHGIAVKERHTWTETAFSTNGTSWVNATNTGEDRDRLSVSVWNDQSSFPFPNTVYSSAYYSANLDVNAVAVQEDQVAVAYTMTVPGVLQELNVQLYGRDFPHTPVRLVTLDLNDPVQQGANTYAFDLISKSDGSYLVYWGVRRFGQGDDQHNITLISDSGIIQSTVRVDNIGEIVLTKDQRILAVTHNETANTIELHRFSALLSPIGTEIVADLRRQYLTWSGIPDVAVSQDRIGIVYGSSSQPGEDTGQIYLVTLPL
jgi:hypothetical protein